ncbi:bifunctional inositol-1 monophosphatase/fructose-1,6-bisphosphatase [Planctomycetes bacterium Poly30]|uniref:Bifunctional inositol-1 monophosphatase/fructose-1,6-bisphosphatase n=1 Tax=Saltatorellus ferox TaxID=2528018 RepID=A0A518EWP6_9BACT|nr:bifunctional inositol-1 monophosphatase/fructose-1,6-bisphosphatase [Planctomycetes bacterium Poly30]
MTDRADPKTSTALAYAWRPLLQDLCAGIRGPVRAALAEAFATARGGAARLDGVTRAVGSGAGDITFAIDVVAEEAVDRWLEDVAARGPISLLTEDAGWRHFGPAECGGAEPLPDFDHGGPRIILDPIDGTRNVMHDLRSAWVVVSFAGPGPSEPRYKDLVYGLVSEIPDSRTSEAREIDAVLGDGARLRRLIVPAASHGAGATEVVHSDGTLHADPELRLDRGYFPFFAFHPSCRADIAALAHRVFETLREEHPSIDLSTVFNDQYISSGGQLALLALGAYRAIVDPRTIVGERTGRPTQTAKAYDMAGAALIATEAGCVVTDPLGEPLDFPLDATTPVDFAGFHNAATAAAMIPHLRAALERLS